MGQTLYYKVYKVANSRPKILWQYGNLTFYWRHRYWLCILPTYRQQSSWCSRQQFRSKNITYRGGRQLQHHKNVNSGKDKSHYDCSSEERTLFQYIQHSLGELGQSLVQSQPERQQYLKRNIIVTVGYMRCQKFAYWLYNLQHKHLECMFLHQLILWEQQLIRHQIFQLHGTGMSHVSDVARCSQILHGFVLLSLITPCVHAQRGEAIGFVRLSICQFSFVSFCLSVWWKIFKTWRVKLFPKLTVALTL